jgi:hypothetical protein
MIVAGVIIIVVAWRRKTPEPITIPDQGTP